MVLCLAVLGRHVKVGRLIAQALKACAFRLTVM